MIIFYHQRERTNILHGLACWLGFNVFCAANVLVDHHIAVNIHFISPKRTLPCNPKHLVQSYEISDQQINSV